MNRRRLLIALTAVPFAAAGRAFAATPPAKGVDEIRKNWRALLPENQLAVSTDPVKKTAAEWKQLLNPAQYEILREDGTERAFTSALNNEKRPGMYICAGCALPLFSSEMKYDSGTGWPSFFTHIPGHFSTKTDFKLIYPRTEYHCVRCGGHHGHVFNDGPPPTHERWCNNGVALRFITSTGKA